MLPCVITFFEGDQLSSGSRSPVSPQCLQRLRAGRVQGNDFHCTCGRIPLARHRECVCLVNAMCLGGVNLCLLDAKGRGGGGGSLLVPPCILVDTP